MTPNPESAAEQNEPTSHSVKHCHSQVASSNSNSTGNIRRNLASSSVINFHLSAAVTSQLDWLVGFHANILVANQKSLLCREFRMYLVESKPPHPWECWVQADLVIHEDQVPGCIAWGVACRFLVLGQEEPRLALLSICWNLDVEPMGAISWGWLANRYHVSCHCDVCQVVSLHQLLDHNVERSLLHPLISFIRTGIPNDHLARPKISWICYASIEYTSVQCQLNAQWNCTMSVEYQTKLERCRVEGASWRCQWELWRCQLNVSHETSRI